MEKMSSITWKSLYGDLFAFVNSKVKDRSLAEDIVQEVFIKVHTKSHQVNEPEKLSGWIYRVASNTVTDHFRKDKKRQLQPVDVETDGGEHEFNECVARCLRILMSTLPDKYREALELTEFENLSQSHLAKRLAISHSGARSRVQRARKMLKDKMDALFIIETDAYGNVIICENRDGCGCNSDC
jgi:RNA polymerase sigma-70 factor (ECF subfamily)